jgi:hypothetical protein
MLEKPLNKDYKEEKTMAEIGFIGLESWGNPWRNTF